MEAVAECLFWKYTIVPFGLRLHGVKTLHYLYIENQYVYPPHQSVIYDLFLKWHSFIIHRNDNSSERLTSNFYVSDHCANPHSRAML